MKRPLSLFILACLCTAAFAESSLLNLKVNGMHCGGCEAKFKTAATNIKGIEAVKEVSAEKGMATILFDPAMITAEKAIQSLAETTGYTVTANTSIGMVQVEGKPSGCCMKGQSSAACKKTTKSCKSEKEGE